MHSESVTAPTHTKKKIILFRRNGYDDVIVIYFTNVAFTCVAIFKLTQRTSTFVVSITHFPFLRNKIFCVCWCCD